MEVAVQNVGVATVASSALLTDLVGVRDGFLNQRDTWSTHVRENLPRLQDKVFVSETVWITVSITVTSESSKPVSSPATTPVVPSFAFSNPGGPVQTQNTPTSATTEPVVPSFAFSNPGDPVQTQKTPPRPPALPQIKTELPFPSFNIANLCPPKTDPIDQQSSSFESCQKTILPGGICCIPSQAAPSNTLSPPTSTFLILTSDTPTSVWSSFTLPSSTINPPSSSSSSLLPSNPPAPSISPSSNIPATTPSPIPPMPTELTTAKTKINLFTILIPCALAAVGIVALAAGIVVWRGKGKRHSVPPPPDMSHRVVNGEKVFEAGNFAVVEAFRPGIEEMSRKEREGFGEKIGGWKRAGYRRYRDSGLPGSGLFSVTKVKEISA